MSSTSAYSPLLPQDPESCGRSDRCLKLQPSPHIIYTKLGKKIINDSITVDGDCYAGDKPIKIRALVEGKTAPQLLYISDLLADNGKQEINDVIKASLKKR